MKSAAPGAAHARWKPAQLLVVALFAAGQALLWLAYYGNGAKRLIGDEQNYQDVALAILGGGAWMPSTIWPPLQSLFLAAIYAIAGVHMLAVQLVQTLLIVGCAIVLRAIWRRVGGVRERGRAPAGRGQDPGIHSATPWVSQRHAGRCLRRRRGSGSSALGAAAE